MFDSLLEFHYFVSRRKFVEGRTVSVWLWSWILLILKPHSRPPDSMHGGWSLMTSSTKGRGRLISKHFQWKSKGGLTVNAFRLHRAKWLSFQQWYKYPMVSLNNQRTAQLTKKCSSRYFINVLQNNPAYGGHHLTSCCVRIIAQIYIYIYIFFF